MERGDGRVACGDSEWEGVGEEGEMGREVGRRRLRGGEKGERKNNGVFRGLVFWILTSQLVCVCVLYFSLNVITVLMED